MVGPGGSLEGHRHCGDSTCSELRSTTLPAPAMQGFPKHHSRLCTGRARCHAAYCLRRLGRSVPILALPGRRLAALPGSAPSWAAPIGAATWSRADHVRPHTHSSPRSANARSLRAGGGGGGVRGPRRCQCVCLPIARSIPVDHTPLAWEPRGAWKTRPKGCGPQATSAPEARPRRGAAQQRRGAARALCEGGELEQRRAQLVPPQGRLRAVWSHLGGFESPGRRFGRSRGGVLGALCGGAGLRGEQRAVQRPLAEERRQDVAQLAEERARDGPQHRAAERRALEEAAGAGRADAPLQLQRCQDLRRRSWRRGSSRAMAGGEGCMVGERGRAPGYSAGHRRRAPLSNSEGRRGMSGGGAGLAQAGTQPLLEALGEHGHAWRALPREPAPETGTALRRYGRGGDPSPGADTRSHTIRPSARVWWQPRMLQWPPPSGRGVTNTSCSGGVVNINWRRFTPLRRAVAPCG